MQILSYVPSLFIRLLALSQMSLPLRLRHSSLVLLPLVILQVEEELLEQEFLERCFQEMLEEEDQEWFIPSRDLNNQGVGQLQQQLNGLSVNDHHSNLEEVAVSGDASDFTNMFFL